MNEDERILSLLENLNRRLTILEQIVLRSQGQAIRNVKIHTHELGSNVKTITEDGLESELHIPTCSMCHRVIAEDEKYFVCHHCSNVLCSDCVIQHNSYAHCEQCLRKYHIDLTKRDYLTLICLANGITETKEISELTLIQDREVEESIIRLTTLNLMEKERKFFGLLTDLKLTDQGRTAITLYRRIYGRDEDVHIFGQALRKHLAEREGFKVGH